MNFMDELLAIEKDIKKDKRKKAKAKRDKKLTMLIAAGAYRDLIIPVKTLEEASRLWIEFREGDDSSCESLGASDMRKGCGDVYKGAKLFARVSYNGRVWDTNDKLLQEATKCL